jgi:protein SCO1/2
LSEHKSMIANYARPLAKPGAGMIAVIFFSLAVVPAWAGQKYEVTGLLLQVDRRQRTMAVSCKEITGYMDAMVMPFSVRDAKMLEGLEPGMTIDFSLVVEKDSSYAESIHVRPFESLELDPAEARRFQLMEKAMAAKSAPADVLRVGQAVPDFTLIDQSRQRVSLSQFAGKVVAITFIYTRCPLPNYCVHLANNLGILQRRFKNQMGQNLVLLTVVIDPVHDQPEALANYARTWKADPRTWHFLTGPLSDIQQICRRFDMAFYPDEALLVHSFHTVIINRSGQLAANLVGNDFTAQQLGDMAEAVMKPSGKAD